MGKLDNIPKKDIFTVPEGYFDKLPGMVQARIEAERPRTTGPVTAGAFALKFVLPVVLIFAAGIAIFQLTDSPRNAETILAAVSDEDLIAYLQDSELTTDDLIDQIDFEFFDLNGLEEESIVLPPVEDDEFYKALELEMELDI